ncbi:methyltransferase [Colwellia psychrerythraea]|uniref:Ribosomal RNA large subunit methyltransferase G n=1 Tax=Colwellia psychrerythraea TaxID=28229 RepID=A0A099KEZ7_COLPS|nr:methyltransferase [Colwellia psychrerythraea]KGJ88936.1 Ribosomal RNA large subunit methyltransferase G [Colwellia psychrerythraea]
MISPFIVNDKNLFLSRFPVAQVNRSLQAWDSADEYLVNHVNEEGLIKANTKLAIFNDAFGALTTNFCHSANDDPDVICINDSFISSQGIRYNIEQNALDDSNITLLSSLDNLPNDIDVILYKIPKSKSLLIEQLIQIKKSVPANCIFIAADRAKEIHSSTLKVFEKHLGTTKTSLAVKKARLVFCQFDNKQVHQSPFPTIWSIAHKSTNDAPSRELIISNHANVYAREKLDIGARYFIDNLPKVAANSTVIDLGCGNGVLGLTVLANQNNAHVHFIDESVMALASAKQNVMTNLPELIEQCEFTLNDCLTDIEGGSVDLILCNPPFHQNTATTDHIAWQMFKDSHRVLKKGGELRIIGNRQLAYHIKLQRLFGNETLIASNDKFVTQSAIKR